MEQDRAQIKFTQWSLSFTNARKYPNRGPMSCRRIQKSLYGSSPEMHKFRKLQILEKVEILKRQNSCQNQVVH